MVEGSFLSITILISVFVLTVLSVRSLIIYFYSDYEKRVYIWDQIIPEIIQFEFEETDEEAESLYIFIGLPYLNNKTIKI